MSGWIQTWIFTAWFRNFLKWTKPTNEDPVLLILDSYYSHTRNLKFLGLARQNYVTVISIPPHPGHKMQLLDVSFMGLFKGYMAEEIRIFYREFKRPVEVTDIAAIVGKAIRKSSSYHIAESGFRRSGIYPYNRSIFPESTFYAETDKICTPWSETLVNMFPNGKANPPPLPITKIKNRNRSLSLLLSRFHLYGDVIFSSSE